jgi:hypothetical protein
MRIRRLRPFLAGPGARRSEVRRARTLAAAGRDVAVLEYEGEDELAQQRFELLADTPGRVLDLIAALRTAFNEGSRRVRDESRREEESDDEREARVRRLVAGEAARPTRSRASAKPPP